MILTPVHVRAPCDTCAVHDVGGLDTLDIRDDGLAVLEASCSELILSSLQK